MQNARLLEGRVFHPNGNELLVGRFAARKLNLHPGDRVELMRRVFRVVGVYETGRAILDSGAAIDLATAQQIFNLGDRVSIVFLDLAEPSRIGEVLGHIGREMPSVEAMPSDLFTESFQRIGMIERYGRRLGILAFLIAALGVCNTLAMNVSERTQEIAMLRAIGWRRSRIAATVVIETMCMIAIGALLAVPLSEAMLLTMQTGDAIGVVPRHVPMPEVIRGMTLAIVAGFVLSLLPLMHAMRVRTATALRAI
jgi:putative ABC transport system permease protein